MPGAATEPVDSRSAVEEDFQRRIAGWEEDYAGLWPRLPAAVPELGAPVAPRRQRENAAAAAELVDRLARRVADYPEAAADRAAWRAELQETVRRFGEERLGWPDGYRRLLLGEEFFESSTAFARAARAFDPAVRLDDMLQALRNLWIANSVQMLLDLPVRLTPALGAYSLLYPYTDNYLDDPAVTEAAKQAFNRRLGRRLAGHAQAAVQPREEAVFRLVETIEGAWPRRVFPEVACALMAIHAGQVRSLRQQRRGAELGEHRLLATSCAKGGASVLADGYLVAGRLDREAAEFCFGYGVFLQLLDDLQDTMVDRRAGHATLFSSRARQTLDEPTSRLYHLIGRVLAGERFAGAAHADQRDLVRRNCVALLVGAVAENPGLFTRRFVRDLEARWPLRFGAMRRLRRRARRRYEATLSMLRRRRRLDSLLDLLVAA